MKKLMMLAALMALAFVVAAPAALAQDVKAEALPGAKANAQAGSEEVQSKADPECADAVAGGTAAKACFAPEKAPPPPPPPKAAPAPAPAPPPKAGPAPAPKPLPPSGGAGIASLTALGAGALLVGGRLLVRRLVR